MFTKEKKREALKGIAIEGIAVILIKAGAFLVNRVADSVKKGRK
jgi:hypothetical protein